MENNFLFCLAQKLMFHSSYKEMKEVLEDYRQFSEDAVINEAPKDIAKSLDPSGNRVKLFFGVVILFCICNVIIFSNLSYFSYSFRYETSFFLSILMPILIYAAIGKKSLLLSSMNIRRKNNIWAYAIQFLYVALFAFYTWKTVSMINMAQIDGADIDFIRGMEKVMMAVVILGIVLFGYLLLTKGAPYFFPLCHSYVVLCFFFRIMAIMADMSDVYAFSDKMQTAWLTYSVGALLCVAWIVVLKKKRSFSNECSN